MKSHSLSVLLVLFSGIGIYTQAQKQVTAPPGELSNITRPGSVQDSGSLGYWADMTPQGRAGGALLGKVTVQGEADLWEPILVSLVCDGKVVNATRTDPKGNFGIVSVPATGALGIHEDTQRQMETQYEGCQIVAALSGFRSNTITVTHRNLRDDPDVGTLSLQKVERATGTALSGTTSAAPPSAVKSYARARLELVDQKPDRAQKELENAVQAYPQYADAWYQLGKLQQIKNPAEARNSYAKALAADPEFVLPYEQLAGLDVNDAKWQEAVNNTGHFLRLDPAGTPQVWYYNALGNFQQGRSDIAQSSAEKSLSMDPLHVIPNTEQLLAVILARKRDYAGAITHLKNCLTYLPPGPNADMVKQQIAQLQQHLAGVNK